MSINNASKFIAKIYERDEAVLALLPEGVLPDGIGTEEIAAIAAAAKNAGWDFDADELQEAYLDSMVLDEDELSAIAGGHNEVGGYSSSCSDNAYEAKGPGGCSSNYYADQCAATWETGSKCTCDDFHSSDSHTIV